MAIGGKLGKVFGAIGSGLSFIPGPWSALGMAFSAASSAAEMGGAAKQRKELEREQAQQGPAQNPAGQMAQDDGTRIESGQAQQAGVQQGAPLTPPPMFRQGQLSLGNYQLQMNQEIADMLIKDAGGLYGD
jgi:hypothetical protein